MKWVKWGGLVLGIVLLVLSFLNASWTTSPAKGKATIIADRNVSQSFSFDGVADEDCTATRINEPTHDALENTARGAMLADRAGADMLGFHVVPTKDGQVVAFKDENLDCRTDGTGPVRDKTLAELKALDIGYGYTADGGKTYPFRGQYVGQIPTIEEIAPYKYRKLLFRIKSDDAKEADALIAALKRSNIPLDKSVAFWGPEKPLDRIRKLSPKSWAMVPEQAWQCSSDYMLQGWLTMTPESCRNSTLIVPLNRQWMVAGWPNRTAERMKAVGATIMLVGASHGQNLVGLTEKKQVGDVPVDFRGYVLVDNVLDVAPVMP